MSIITPNLFVDRIKHQSAILSAFQLSKLPRKASQTCRNVDFKINFKEEVSKMQLKFEQLTPFPYTIISAEFVDVFHTNRKILSCLIWLNNLKDYLGVLEFLTSLTLALVLRTERNTPEPVNVPFPSCLSVLVSVSVRILPVRVLKIV